MPWLLKRLQAQLAQRGNRRGIVCGPWAMLSLLCALLGSAPAWPQQPDPSREYQVKAVFLLNFSHFVEWPEAAFPEPQSPFIIGVLGEDPFGPTLDEVVRGELVGKRPLQVRRYRRVDEIESCQILFISNSELQRLDAIQASLSGRPILTVGDSPEFTRSGGIIRFDTIGGKIRLRINLEASKRVGLTLSSRLLRPAEIVASE